MFRFQWKQIEYPKLYITSKSFFALATWLWYQLKLATPLPSSILWLNVHYFSGLCGVVLVVWRPKHHRQQRIACFQLLLPAELNEKVGYDTSLSWPLHCLVHFFGWMYTLSLASVVWFWLCEDQSTTDCRELYAFNNCYQQNWMKMRFICRDLLAFNNCYQQNWMKRRVTILA